MSSRRPVVGVTLDFLPVGARTKYTVYDRYHASLRAAGALALALPPEPDALREQLALVRGVLLPGGDDLDPGLWGESVPADHVASHPARTEYEMALVEACVDADVPLLGVCLGAQTLNVARGGSLVTSLAEVSRHHDAAGGLALRHPVNVAPGSLLARCVGLEHGGSIVVNSSHRRAPGRLGDGLVASATADDGVVEAVELPSARFCLGVQWHPESRGMVDDAGADSVSQRIFAAFVDACR